MSLLIHNAHNGATYEIPKPLRFSSVQKLKLHIHETTQEVAGVEDLILLTSFGIKLDFHMVNEMQELFLFDRRLFQNNAKTSILVDYLAQEHRAVKPQTEHVAAMVAELQRATAQINVMFRALNIIFQFTSNFVFSAEKSVQNWRQELEIVEQKSLAKTWPRHHAELAALPPVTFQHSKSLKMSDFLSVSGLKSASDSVQTHMPEVQAKTRHVLALLRETNALKVAIDDKIAGLRRRSMQKLAKKPEVVRQIEQIGKTDKPAESAVVQECYELVQTAIAFKAQMSEEMGSIFGMIANSQKKSVEIKNDTKTLRETMASVRRNEAVLSMTVDLPLLFGFVLIERRRQYEWNDYFTRGLVHNVSEQMAVLIEHERKFQSIWIRRFGPLVAHMGACMQVHVPGVDVSIVNSSAAPFERLDFVIERDDLQNYIEAAKKTQPEKSVLLLERNFKDLVASTEKLKAATKIVASLATAADCESSSRIIPAEEETVMAGLRCRIKKLEDLLHQQQYKKLDEWPVVEREDSALFDRPRLSHHFSEPNNPIKLLSKTSSSRLDASGTIDKHLENLRLKREAKEEKIRAAEVEKRATEAEKRETEAEKRVAEAEKRVAEAEKRVAESEKRATEAEQKFLEIKEKAEELERTAQDAELKHLESERKYRDAEKQKHEMEQLYSEMQQKFQDLETKWRASQERLSESEKQLVQAESNGQKTTEQYAELGRKFQALQETHSILKQDEKQHQGKSEKDTSVELSSKLAEQEQVNSELISNMTSKEADFRNERSQLSGEISRVQAENNQLRASLDTKTDDFEALMEVMQSKLQRMDDNMYSVLKTVQALVHSTGRLFETNMAFFYEFAEILESMGLLLVADTNLGVTEYRIRRVKGLRSKKEQSEAHEISVGGATKSFRSAVVHEISQRCERIQQLRPQTADLDAEPETQVVTCMAETSEYLARIEDMRQLVSFKNDAPEPFFLNAVLKRFRDVEGFAKKLTKDKQRDKISVSHFQEGDLVLFLPTMENNAWAAFNVDTPHYFLDTTQDLGCSEYILSRITRIGEHVADSHNPYGLAEGTRWYSVST